MVSGPDLEDIAAIFPQERLTFERFQEQTPPFEARGNVLAPPGLLRGEKAKRRWLVSRISGLALVFSLFFVFYFLFRWIFVAHFLPGR